MMHSVHQFHQFNLSRISLTNKKVKRFGIFLFFFLYTSFDVKVLMKTVKIAVLLVCICYLPICAEKTFFAQIYWIVG